MKIIKNFRWLIIMALIPLFSACSWEDLPSYEEAEINSVQFRYRWKSDVYIDDITGEPLVLEVGLSTNANLVSDGNIEVVITVPGAQSYFTQEVRDQISLSNLCCVTTISTAAKIEPADGHKVLGIPDDWSTPHKFTVTAANGTKKTWTITVTALNK